MAEPDSNPDGIHILTLVLFIFKYPKSLLLLIMFMVAFGRQGCCGAKLTTCQCSFYVQKVREHWLFQTLRCLGPILLNLEEETLKNISIKHSDQ